MIEIKKQILDLGLKQIWLAEKLEVSPAILNYWLQETRPIPDDKKKELKAIIKRLELAI